MLRFGIITLLLIAPFLELKRIRWYQLSKPCYTFNRTIFGIETTFLKTLQYYQCDDF